MLSRVSTSVSSALGRKGTKSYCCDKIDESGMNNEEEPIGSNCKPSITGQCNVGYGTGQNYKFRCDNVEDDVDDNEYSTIYEGTKPNCKYVPGVLGRVGMAANSGLRYMKYGGIKKSRKSRKGSRSRKSRKNKKKSRKH